MEAARVFRCLLNVLPFARRRREGKLKTFLLEHGEVRSSNEAKKALAYCQLCISEYDHLWWRDGWLWTVCLTITIGGGIVGAFAGIVPIPQGWESYGWMRGIPAALVAAAAAAMTGFGFRENAIRFEQASEALWHELVRFQTLSAPYNKGEPEDTSAFVNKICDLIDIEVHNWGTFMAENSSEPKARTPQSPPA
jgi:hypothetical protein